jgi:hypothetical protein
MASTWLPSRSTRPPARTRQSGPQPPHQARTPGRRLGIRARDPCRSQAHIGHRRARCSTRARMLGSSSARDRPGQQPLPGPLVADSFRRTFAAIVRSRRPDRGECERRPRSPLRPIWIRSVRADAVSGAPASDESGSGPFAGRRACCSLTGRRYGADGGSRCRRDPFVRASPRIATAGRGARSGRGTDRSRWAAEAGRGALVAR